MQANLHNLITHHFGRVSEEDVPGRIEELFGEPEKKARGPDRPVRTVDLQPMVQANRERLDRAFGAEGKIDHDIVDAQRINLFSDHYEANRHFLDSDIPGWDWPRCGQSMIMTVGPSGAGKSTWSATQGTEVVSSDAIRSELTAAPDLPGDQSEIFRRVRYRSSRVLSNGRDVIVDAMHVEVKNRIRQVAIAPPDVAVRYAVIDRPLAEKQRDAGWRAGRGIVERYHEEFAQQVVVVLAGDGDPRVKVQDLRKVSTK